MLKFLSTLSVGMGLGLLVALKLKEGSETILRDCGVLLISIGVIAAFIAGYIAKRRASPR